MRRLEGVYDGTYFYGRCRVALKSLGDLARGLVNAHDKQAIKATANVMRDTIAEVQTSLIAALGERAAMQRQAGELEKKIAALETWDAEKSRYALKRLEPGLFVLELRPEKPVGERMKQICQTCFQRAKKSILHSDEQRNGIYHLSGHECGTRLQTGQYRPPDLSPLRNGGPHSWMAG